MADPDAEKLREIARQLEIHANSYHADTPNFNAFMAMSETIRGAADRLDASCSIAVEERLPGQMISVLAYRSDDKEWIVARYDHGDEGWYYAENITPDTSGIFTHWMPMPADAK